MDYDAVFSPDGRWVVFTSERRGNPDLYVIDLQQEGVPSARLLIDSAAMEDQAAFSPSGDAIAFVGTASGNTDIYTIRFDPSATQTIDKAVRLTQDSGGDFRPSFSPDGMHIAFSTDRDTAPYGHPSFSFTRQRVGEIYVMDRDGKNPHRLTNSPGWDGSPKWSPDGATIYFYSERPRELPGPPTSPILGQEGGFRIWSMGADGEDQIHRREWIRHPTRKRRLQQLLEPRLQCEDSGDGVPWCRTEHREDASRRRGPWSRSVAGAGLPCHG